MPRTLRSIIKALIPLLLIMALVVGVGGFIVSRRSFPDITGEVAIEGVAGPDGPVDVYRDANGIPHIYAGSLHDLFFAQGYVQAQDRFWQMDFQRAVGRGRLARIFGEGQSSRDAFLRTLGWERVAEEEWEAAPPEVREALTAFSEGVNAYLADHQGSALSLEYAVLKLSNRTYRPGPWEPVDTLVWAKAMAWDLRSNLDVEIARAVISKEVGADRVDDLFPPYPDDRPVIVPEAGATGSQPATRSVTAEAAPLLARVADRVDSLDEVLGVSGADIGSNNWGIGGSRTSTGMPILANDPHLGIQMPSTWYANGLHCAPVTAACDLEVVGFSLLGVPAVVIGHNDRIAWGVTNLAADVMDLYIERVNPDHPDQYEVNGQWIDMDTSTETVLVAGADPVEVEVRVTRHGPVVSDTFEALEDFEDIAGVEVPDHYAIALRWTALEPTHTFEAILGINRADNWSQFRTALTNWDVPSQNFVYADVEGNIGYQTPGRIPVRAAGDGRIPAPGWTDEHEWTGFIPFEDLPTRYNPPEGFIVTANNAVVDAAYPRLLGSDWSYGLRAGRIIDLITQAPDPIGLDYVERMQLDAHNPYAEDLMPFVMGLEAGTPEVGRAQQLLEAWSVTEPPYRNTSDSAGAALFAAFWRSLLAETFHDELPEDYRPLGRDRWLEVFRKLLADPGNQWWDNRLTAAVETRDAILDRALRAAWVELTDTLGDDPEGWRWGDLHTVTFRNAAFGSSGFAPIGWLFNRGPYPVSGGTDLVNATSWAATEGYEVLALPSMRMIVDLGDLSRSRGVLPTGQSGHAFHRHYTDMVDLWTANATQPLLWERSTVEAGAEGHLRLLPAA